MNDYNAFVGSYPVFLYFFKKNFFVVVKEGWLDTTSTQ